MEKKKALHYKFISILEEITHIPTTNMTAYLVNFHENIYIYLKSQNFHLFSCHAIVIYQDQILESKKFTSSIYIVDNYHNIILQNFVLDLIPVKNLKSLAFCFASLVEKKAGNLK